MTTHGPWTPIGLLLGAWALSLAGSRTLVAQTPTNQQAVGMAERLIIADDDTAMLKAMVARQGVYAMPWLRLSDPDGGLEMIYLLREPTVRLLGITCAMGCSTTEVCMASIKRILELTGRTDVPSEARLARAWGAARRLSTARVLAYRQLPDARERLDTNCPLPAKEVPT